MRWGFFMKIFQLLSKEEAFHMLQSIKESSFLEGKLSANGLAKKVKNNYEIDINNQNAKNILNKIFNLLMESEWLKNHYLPKTFSLPIINKYTTGNTYGRHFDGSFLRQGAHYIRADLSYTLMLSSPEDYQGGALIIENGLMNTKIKLDIGQILVYPSLLWHQVEPITSGERVACVGWIESSIKNS